MLNAAIPEEVSARLRKIVVLGGTGFVGRRLAQELINSLGSQPEYVVHRTRPIWIDNAGVSIRTLSLENDAEMLDTLRDCSVLINLLRPDGSGWYADLLKRVLPIAATYGVDRYIHTSSIDVYGGARDVYLTEDTQPIPLSAYAAEHLVAEQIAIEIVPQTIVLRSGAVFGPGGQNIVSFAKEAASAPDWRLAARRILYARCRMHLVSVDALCGVIGQLAKDRTRLFRTELS